MKHWTVCASILCICFTYPAVAQHFVEYGVNLSLGPTIYYEEYRQGQVASGPVVHSEFIPDYGDVYGEAMVGFGVNRARVDLNGTNPNDPLVFDYGFASSRYFDSFTFDDPALNGTHGFFDATLYLHGSGSVNLSPGYLNSPDTEFNAFWHAVINVAVDGVTDPIGNAVQSLYYAGEWYKEIGSSTVDYFGDPLNTYERQGTFEFIYGQPILMDTFLQVDTRIDNQASHAQGTLETTIDLGNSAYWGGIRNLRDAAGNPVSGEGYHSSSGFDYRNQPGDFDGNRSYDCADIDALVANIASGSNSLPFDITGDGQVNGTDLQRWLGFAGGANLASGNPFLLGDGNLDGVVDGQDFNIWNANKFTSVAAWCSGDFNADGVVEGSDFGIWNEHKFTRSSASQVPEPSITVIPFALALLFGIQRSLGCRAKTSSWQCFSR
jgi:hypothetical protein